MATIDLKLKSYDELQFEITRLNTDNYLKQQEIERQSKAQVILDDMLADYNYRINKAIEYINHAQNYGTMAQVMPHLKPYVNGDDLLNILQGDEE